MPREYRRVLRAVASTPWAIEPTKGAEIYAFLRLKAHGIILNSIEIAAASGGREAAPRRQDNGAVAVLPVRGVIAHRAEQVDDMSGPGGTSTERLGQRFDQALADPAVSAIVLDVESPGGAVDGVPELAAKIREARGRKPIVAVANAYAASAAYWIASAADELVVPPSAEIGSIGVYTAHEDWSRAFESEGVRTTLIHAGRYKVEGSPFEPLSDEARAAIQARVDAYYAMFVRDVAAGRGVKEADVRGGFGEGRMVGAADAVRLGMADRIDTLDGVIARLGGAGTRPGERTGGRHAAIARRRLALL